MEQRFPHALKAAVFSAAFVLIAFFAAVPVAAQDDADPDREEAVRLMDENKYLDALPILEKIILNYPNDAELWAQFGIALISNSVVLTTPEERREEQLRGIKALKRALQLGTDNQRALDLLDQFADADGTDNFVTADPEVEKALREGEAFFGRGDYENAFKSYERAHKLDPKNYEAVLFMGDCFYARQRYAESEVWFAKAVELDPEREMAYRFWGDALFFQDKLDEAREKFIEAAIADPYGRMGWTGLDRWAEASKATMAFPAIIPPGNELGGAVEIKESLLKTEDGTHHWLEYSRAIDKLEPGNVTSTAPRPEFRTDVAAWRSVAAAFRKDLKAGKIKYPDPGLVTLLKIEDDGFLEAYILFIRPYDHFGDEYIKYRKANKDKLKAFILRYVLHSDK